MILPSSPSSTHPDKDHRLLQLPPHNSQLFNNRPNDLHQYYQEFKQTRGRNHNLKDNNNIAKISDFESQFFKSSKISKAGSSTKTLRTNREGELHTAGSPHFTSPLTKKCNGVPTEYSARILEVMKVALQTSPNCLILRPEHVEELRTETEKTVRHVFALDDVWREGVEACNIEHFEIEVDDEENPQEEGAHTSIKLIKMVPQALDTSRPSAAIVYAHGEASVSGKAELYVPEACRIALSCNCTVFSIDCRAAPEHKCPTPQ